LDQLRSLDARDTSNLTPAGTLPFATAERSDALFAPQAFEYDADFLFGGELAADDADGLLGRALMGHGFFLLSESRTFSWLIPRFVPDSADGEHH
jgi:hypothetical protein